jgi:hypothetical protein
LAVAELAEERLTQLHWAGGVLREGGGGEPLLVLLGKAEQVGEILGGHPLDGIGPARLVEPDSFATEHVMGVAGVMLVQPVERGDDLAVPGQDPVGADHPDSREMVADRPRMRADRSARSP